MTQVPRVLPRGVGPSIGGNDDLTHLESYRDQLRSVITSEESTSTDLVFWLRLIMLAAFAGIGMLLLLAEYISATDLIGMVVIGFTLIFILTFKVLVFGEPYHIGTLIIYLLGGGGSTTTPGEPTVRDLLADCETKISRLKDTARDQNPKLR